MADLTAPALNEGDREGIGGGRRDGGENFSLGGGGELFAVLGPSGAGKTTLIDVLAGAVREHGALEVTGSVHLRGHALGLRERREQAAYIHQEDVLLGTATVRE